MADETTPQEEAATPDAQGQEPEKPAEVKDSHGQPGINRDKYQRDIKAKDDEIASLKKEKDELLSQAAQYAKTEASNKELNQRIEALEQQIEDAKLESELKDHGCLNFKAAKALLDDYEGNIKKLKEACPYLFDEKKGATGLKPDGAAHGKTSIEDKIDKAFQRR